MSDRLRPDPVAAFESLPSAEREIRVEQLLLSGLDQYFAGEYERAISTWTRVLFLDRGHARAKAYIDRARGAIAERQRESEELLHKGVAAFNRGETESARRLLTSAVERGGPQEVALAFLDRLARLERPGAVPGTRGDTTPLRRSLRPVAAGERGRWRVWLLPAGVVVALALVFLYVQQSSERSAPFRFLSDSGSGEAALSGWRPDELPLPSGAEIDLERARTLVGAGHARDALRLVERVRPGDPLRPEADRLREQIQRVLLSLPDSAPQEPLTASSVPAVREQ